MTPQFTASAYVIIEDVEKLISVCNTLRKIGYTLGQHNTDSLDDFIITHFTKGPGIDTLSTKIYTEVKKGIKPEMYALSTIIFITVLFLLILVNRPTKKEEEILIH